MFLYNGRMDWGGGYLDIIVGMGGGVFANKNCIWPFFQMPWGMFVAGIDSHISSYLTSADNM